MPKSKTEHSRKLRNKTSTAHKANKLKSGVFYKFEAILRIPEIIEKAKLIKNKPAFLKKALETLNENGEIN